MSRRPLWKNIWRWINTNVHSSNLSVDRQDYYIWKSQQTLLRVSSRGRLLAETQSTLPKTYSTRRGPLLLFSQVTRTHARVAQVTINQTFYVLKPEPVFFSLTVLSVIGSLVSLRGQRQEEAGCPASRSPGGSAGEDCQRTEGSCF